MRILQVNKVASKEKKKVRVKLCIPGVIPRILYLAKHMLLLVKFNRHVGSGQQLGAHFVEQKNIPFIW